MWLLYNIHELNILNAIISEYILHQTDVFVLLLWSVYYNCIFRSTVNFDFFLTDHVVYFDSRPSNIRIQLISERCLLLVDITIYIKCLHYISECLKKMLASRYECIKSSQTIYIVCTCKRFLINGQIKYSRKVQIKFLFYTSIV